MRLGMMAVYVLLPAGLWAQTTYSSPVRVTNTPLPVNGDVKVTGNVPVVNPTGVPMQVKAWDTIPVAQQGTVTVAPQGGSLAVTPQGGSFSVTPAAGTMPVTVNGTPTVGFAAGQNEVKVAKPRPWGGFFGGVVIDAGQTDGSFAAAEIPLGGMIEVESIVGECTVSGDAKLAVEVRAYTVNTGVPSPVPIYLASVDQGLIGPVHHFVFAFHGKLYLRSNQTIEFRAKRSVADNNSAVACQALFSGRVHE